VLDNTAVVASDTGDLDPSNNTATSTSTIGREANLSLTKVARRASVELGQDLTYDLTVTNHGPSPALGVVLTDALPAAVTPGTVTASQGSCTLSGQTVTCALGDLQKDAVATVTISVQVLPEATGTLANTATVVPPVGTTDPAPADNSATATTAVVRQAEVALTKTVTPDTVEVGGNLTYVLTITNRGPAPATDVMLTDPLPTAVTPGTVTASQGSCTLASRTVTCAMGTLAPDASATVTITATRDAPEPFSNTASVAATEADPNPADNTATATTTGSAAEICDNCKDDDGDGLTDAEDPDCCTAQPLTVIKARLRPGKATLRLRAKLGAGAFSGVDPRQQSVRLQIRNQGGEPVCCTIPQDHWVKVLGRTLWFRDRTMSICPPITAACLTRPKKGPLKTTIIAGGQTASGGLGSPIDITLSAGDQCVRGRLTLRSTGTGRAVFP